ncbi:MAG: glutamyl-tRNA reductase [Firmicutes bacterium]|nr:glutamyl-tRNA reductase [Bacillota bacterium]
MDIGVIGVNHERTPSEIRQRVSFTSTKKKEIIKEFLDKGIREIVIISTCNRSEIYIASKKEELNKKLDMVKDFLKENIKVENPEDYIFIKKNKQAIRYLYLVTAGLCSIVLGEDQILGQVKKAHEFSMDLKASKKLLNKLFREAVTTAKTIKNEIKISEHPLSVSYIGVKFLKQQIGSFKGKKGLIIGAGEMGRLAFENLLEEGLEKIYVTNRSHGRLIDLSKEYPQITTIAYKKRYSLIDKVDILISATASPHTVIKKENMPTIKNRLNIMDLAMPKDIDENISDFKNINLYNVDDLKKISIENKTKREKLSKKAIELIDIKVNDFIKWRKTIKVDPLISSVNKKNEIIKEDVLDYINRKIDLDIKDKEVIEKMVTSGLNRVLRNPVLKLKKIEDKNKVNNYIKMLNDLFELKYENY